LEIFKTFDLNPISLKQKFEKQFSIFLSGLVRIRPKRPSQPNPTPFSFSFSISETGPPGHLIHSAFAAHSARSSFVSLP
jgi:hypothetical protein